MSLVASVCALVLAAAVTSRFPPVQRFVPDLVVFVVAGAALFAAVAVEARLKRGTVGPLWMQVKFAPRLALALALSFCTTVIAQTLQVSLGPVDLAFPATAPLGINALWFFVFTLGFSGIGMMSAPSVFLPVLHPPAKLLKKLPSVVGVVVYAVVGAVTGVVFARLLVFPPVVGLVEKGRVWADSHAQLLFSVTLALTVGPALLPFGKDSDDDEEGGDDAADD